MKNQTLSIEQMQKLKALGVDTSKASMVLLFHDEYGECVVWEVENHGKDKPLYEFYDDEVKHWVSTTVEYFDAETGRYDHSYRGDCGVFTLQDICELFENVKYKCVGFPVMFFDYNYTLRHWELALRNPSGFSNPIIKEKTPIDAAYKMLVWLAENNHLNKV